MTLKHTATIAIASALLFLAVVSCDREDTTGLEEATADTEPLVFDDEYAPGATYQAFMNSKEDAVQVDRTEAAVGTASLKVTVPPPSEEPPWFAGGAFTNEWVRDLSGYNALTFMVRASMNATLDVAGIANDNTGNSQYIAELRNIPIGPAWKEVVIPIPNSSVLTLEKGLFWFAEGHENGQGYELWFDEIRFTNVDGISNPRPWMHSKTVSAWVGATLGVDTCRTTFDYEGSDVTITHLPGYFTLESSADTVAVGRGGDIRVVGPGSATITAMLGSTVAEGSIVVNSTLPPAAAAPTPVHPPTDVVSIFSDDYNDHPVETMLAEWSMPAGQVKAEEYDFGGDVAMVYTNLQWAGILFEANLIDAVAAGMSSFHIDIWAPGGLGFEVKLVDFGPNGVSDYPLQPGDPGSDDTEGSFFLYQGSNPPWVTGQWISVDVPLTAFPGLTGTEHLAQLVIAGVNTVFVDNIYFHK